jgi:hypothetical protein
MISLSPERLLVPKNITSYLTLVIAGCDKGVENEILSCLSNHPNHTHPAHCCFWTWRAVLLRGWPAGTDEAVNEKTFDWLLLARSRLSIIVVFFSKAAIEVLHSGNYFSPVCRSWWRAVPDTEFPIEPWISLLESRQWRHTALDPDLATLTLLVVVVYSKKAHNQPASDTVLKFPTSVRRILRGDHPLQLNADRLIRMVPLPVGWSEQRVLLGLTT